MKTRLLLAATAAGIAMASAASAADPGPYIGLGVGLNASVPSSVRVYAPNNPVTPFSSEASFDKGWIGLGAIGYRWDGGYRTELEVGYRRAGLDKFDDAYAAAGHQGVFGVMANVLYDIGNYTSVRPYIGGGIGAAWNKWSNVSVAPNPAFPTGTPVWNDTSSTLFQYQAIGGVSFPASERTDIFIEYRYIGTSSAKFMGGPPAASAISSHGDVSHNVLLGVRFFFGSPPVKAVAAAAPPPPPPPAPPPPPPAPPPPPPVPQKFLVFFDFDRSAIRDDARKIISEAADYAKKNGKAVIHATGHADTSGSDAYNMALSERRARAVAAELVKMGFTANQIDVTWKGESQPLVQTGDGVREPQNRRVEIVLDR